MNPWKRAGKWLIKGVAWSVVYLGSALSLDLAPSWRLLALIVICSVWGTVLDCICPTDTSSVSRPNGETRE